METIYFKNTILNHAKKFISTTWYNAPTTLHSTYFEYFNLVDIGDGYYYSANDNHPNQSWKNKMLQAIMRIGTMNAWSYYIQTEYKPWIDFRTNLTSQLVKYQ